MLSVKGFKGVYESMKSYFNFETFDGDNALFCEKCDKKTPSKKGETISKLPPVLTIALNRIEMDWGTMQRKKINDRFEFPLELDMSDFLASEVSASPDESLYELKAIVIHSGGPYGGHYYTYIKDELKQGVWNLEVPDSFSEKPTEVDKTPPSKEEPEN